MNNSFLFVNKLKCVVTSSSPPVFKILFFLCILFYSIPAQYRFDSFTTDNGLPQNGVRSITQTPDGYLWFTTFDGLVRFDGVKFTVFDKNNTKGIAGNRFSMLEAEPDGTLIAGTEDSGLTIYKNGVFKTLTTADGLPSNTTSYFHHDIKGELFVITPAGSCYIRNDKIVPTGDVGVPDNNFNYLSPAGNLWIYENEQIWELTPGQRKTIYPVKINFFNSLLSGIKPFEDSKGNLWFGDLSGIYILKDGNFRRLTEKDGVPKGALLRPFVEDESGGIWFASGWGETAKLGAVRYFDGKFSAWGDKYGLASLFKDREETIWISTDKGLKHLRKQFITSYSKDAGLINTEVYPLLQLKNGDIYIGTTQGLSVYHNGVISTPHIKNQFGDRISVTALFEDEKKRLWVGAVGNLYILENDKLRAVPDFYQNTVWAVKNDRDGNIWVASEKGLFKFQDDRATAEYTTAGGLPSNDIKVIYQDHSGALWFGTYGGLVRFENGKFVLWTTGDGLASNRVRSIYEDDRGTLWVGTYDGGLSRFRDGKFINYTIENGLFNNGVFQILEDDNHNFWISCNKGIYRVNRAELEEFAAGQISKINSTAYGKQDGMLNTEANGGRQPAGIKTTDGKFWFPTQDGVAVFDPKEISFNSQPPPVQIESVLIDHAAADFQNGITLQANESNLEIIYTGISFIKPEQVKFRYRIEGLDEDWTDVNTRREVYFPFLPAGQYKFQVIAANSDGVWNNDGAEMSIRVSAPFWQKPWFISLSTLLTLFVIFIIFKLREKELKRRQAVQQDFSRRLIESQEQERKRIASELHDSLGQYLLAIKNWALFGLNALAKENPAREYLDEVSETTSLALSEVREIAHNLRPYQLERLGLTNTLEYMLKSIKASSPINFTVEIENVDGILSKESEIVFYRIIQETVNNVIKHSAAGNVGISIKPDAGRNLEFECRDDGRGFDVESAKNSPQSGLGLAGINERLKILGGECKIESEIGKGTDIFIKIHKSNE